MERKVVLKNHEKKTPNLNKMEKKKFFLNGA